MNFPARRSGRASPCGVHGDVRGFSLVEVLVGLAIMVVIATVVTPNLVAVMDKARLDRAIASLENFSDAVDRFERDVNSYPANLAQLSAPISTADSDLCGASYPEGHVQKWAGPYLNRVVPSTGVPVAIGTVLTDLSRVDDGHGNSGLLQFTIPRVTEEDAVAVNRRVDGDDSSAANAIRWTAPDGEGLVTLTFVKPVKGC